MFVCVCGADLVCCLCSFSSEPIETRRRLRQVACERANNCELDWEILQEVCRSELQLAARGALCTETEMSRSYRCTNEVYDCDESRTREMSSFAHCCRTLKSQLGSKESSSIHLAASRSLVPAARSTAPQSSRLRAEEQASL